jgi:hypothetical protein
MDDVTTSAPIGGADWELGRASERMSEARTAHAANPTPENAALVRAAEADFAAAIGSKQTAMIAGFLVPVLTKLEKAAERDEQTRADVGTIAGQVTGLVARFERIETADETYRKKMLDWRTELRLHIDARFDALGNELDTRVGALEQDFQTFKTDQQVFNAQSQTDRADLREMIKRTQPWELEHRLKRVERILFAVAVMSSSVVILLVLATLASRSGG